MWNNVEQCGTMCAHVDSQPVLLVQQNPEGPGVQVLLLVHGKPGAPETPGIALIDSHRDREVSITLQLNLNITFI